MSGLSCLNRLCARASWHAESKGIFPRHGSRTTTTPNLQIRCSSMRRSSSVKLFGRRSSPVNSAPARCPLRRIGCTCTALRSLVLLRPVVPAERCRARVLAREVERWRLLVLALAACFFVLLTKTLTNPHESALPALFLVFFVRGELGFRKLATDWVFACGSRAVPGGHTAHSDRSQQEDVADVTLDDFIIDD